MGLGAKGSEGSEGSTGSTGDSAAHKNQKRREVYMPQKMTIRKERFVLHTSFYHSAEGCLFEAVYPPPSARPFFKGLLSWQGKAHSPSEVVP